MFPADGYDYLLQREEGKKEENKRKKKRLNTGMNAKLVFRLHFQT